MDFVPTRAVRLAAAVLCVTTSVIYADTGVGVEAGDAQWPQFGFDSRHSRLAPYAPASNGSQRWCYNTGLYGENSVAYASPTIGSDGTVYIKSFAFALASGAVVWQSPVNFLSSTVIVGGSVIGGTFDGRVVAVDARSGVAKWTYATGGQVFSSPTHADGVVYVGSWDYNVYALNATSGALMWKHRTGLSVASSPAVANGLLYVGSSDNLLYCLTAKAGTVVWTYTGDSAIESSPALSADLSTVYVGSDHGKFVALDALTGALKWTFTAVYAEVSSPAVGRRAVYVGSNDQSVHALNPSTGVELWSVPTSDWVQSSPSLAADDTVYIGAGPNLLAISPQGHLLWSALVGVDPTAPGSVQSSPALAADGTVVVGCNSGYVCAFK